MSARISIERLGAYLVRELRALDGARDAALRVTVREAELTLPFRAAGAARPVAAGEPGRPLDPKAALERLADLRDEVRLDAKGLAEAPEGEVAPLTLYIRF